MLDRKKRRGERQTRAGNGARQRRSQGRCRAGLHTDPGHLQASGTGAARHARDLPARRGRRRLVFGEHAPERGQGHRDVGRDRDLRSARGRGHGRRQPAQRARDPDRTKRSVLGLGGSRGRGTSRASFRASSSYANGSSCGPAARSTARSFTARSRSSRAAKSRAGLRWATGTPQRSPSPSRPGGRRNTSLGWTTETARAD